MIRGITITAAHRRNTHASTGVGDLVVIREIRRAELPIEGNFSSALGKTPSWLEVELVGDGAG
jgi:hypothetical protein